MLEKVEVKRLEDRVIELPGKPPCMLDRDLARAYGVETMDLNRARTRNPKKFIDGVDCFQLTVSDMTNCHIDYKGGHLPYAYTKKGAYMFATILNTDEAIAQAVAVIEGFCTYSLLMEEVRAGRITVKPNPQPNVSDEIFGNMKRELLEMSPIWRKILRYKGLGLKHKEISLLLYWDVTTVRRHVRRMESCGLLVPPSNLPRLQKMVLANLKHRFN